MNKLYILPNGDAIDLLELIAVFINGYSIQLIFKHTDKVFEYTLPSIESAVIVRNKIIEARNNS